MDGWDSTGLVIKVWYVKPSEQVLQSVRVFKSWKLLMTHTHLMQKQIRILKFNPFVIYTENVFQSERLLMALKWYK